MWYQNFKNWKDLSVGRSVTYFFYAMNYNLFLWVIDVTVSGAVALGFVQMQVIMSKYDKVEPLPPTLNENPLPPLKKSKQLTIFLSVIAWAGWKRRVGKNYACSIPLDKVAQNCKPKGRYLSTDVISRRWHRRDAHTPLSSSQNFMNNSASHNKACQKVWKEKTEKMTFSKGDLCIQANSYKNTIMAFFHWH